MSLARNIIDEFPSELPPVSLHQISEDFGLSDKKSKDALMTALPAVLRVIKAKTVTPYGAQGLIDLVHEGGFDDADAANASVSRRGEKGKDVLGRMLDGKISSVTKQVATSAGLSENLASKFVGVASATVFTFIGSKMRSGGFGPIALSGVLSELSPDIKTSRQPFSEAPIFGWIPWILGAGAIAAGLAWYLTRPQVPDRAPTIANILPSQITAPAIGGVAPFLSNLSPQVDEIQRFLADSSLAGTTRSFSFQDLGFATNATAPRADGETPKSELARLLAIYPNVKVKIEGHTDSVGDATANQDLSLSRAMTVRDSLITRGIDANRIDIAGSGERNPIATNSTAAGRQMNRRIDIIVQK
jgi:outer membrane protein OmpA-like peptidoglycan-associated protein